jgi:hypothetical protein
VIFWIDTAAQVLVNGSVNREDRRFPPSPVEGRSRDFGREQLRAFGDQFDILEPRHEPEVYRRNIGDRGLPAQPLVDGIRVNLQRLDRDLICECHASLPPSNTCRAKP